MDPKPSVSSVSHGGPGVHRSRRCARILALDQYELRVYIGRDQIGASREGPCSCPSIHSGLSIQNIAPPSSRICCSTFLILNKHTCIVPAPKGLSCHYFLHLSPCIERSFKCLATLFLRCQKYPVVWSRPRRRGSPGLRARTDTLRISPAISPIPCAFFYRCLHSDFLPVSPPINCFYWWLTG